MGVHDRMGRWHPAREKAGRLHLAINHRPCRPGRDGHLSAPRRQLLVRSLVEKIDQMTTGDAAGGRADRDVGSTPQVRALPRGSSTHSCELALGAAAVTSRGASATPELAPRQPTHSRRIDKRALVQPHEVRRHKLGRKRHAVVGRKQS